MTTVVVSKKWKSAPLGGLLRLVEEVGAGGTPCPLLPASGSDHTFRRMRKDPPEHLSGHSHSFGLLKNLK